MKRFLFVSLFLLVVIVCGSFIKTINDNYVYQLQYQEAETEAVELIAVIDGDTLLVKNASDPYKVRLIGVNTPESVHQDESKNTVYGDMASDYTKLILDGYVGETIYLSFDIEKEDKYGRTLAYVYLTAEPSINSMLNYRLVKDGYAQAMTIPPNVTYSTEFREAEMAAREYSLGLWQYDEVF